MAVKYLGGEFRGNPTWRERLYRMRCWVLYAAWDLKPLFLALAIALVAGTLDIVSTLLPMPPDMVETNPFARHPDGSFWPFRGVIVKGLWTAELALAGIVLYFCLRRLNETWAKVAAMAPLLFMSYHWVNAAITNVLISLGWYVPLRG